MKNQSKWLQKLWTTLSKMMGHKWIPRHQNDTLGLPNNGSPYFLALIFLEFSALSILKQKENSNSHFSYPLNT